MTSRRPFRESRRSSAFRWMSGRAKCMRFSARTAQGNRPSARSSPASTPATKARCLSMGRRSATSTRPRLDGSASASSIRKGVWSERSRSPTTFSPDVSRRVLSAGSTSLRWSPVRGRCSSSSAETLILAPRSQLCHPLRRRWSRSPKRSRRTFACSYSTSPPPRLLSPKRSACSTPCAASRPTASRSSTCRIVSRKSSWCATASPY